MSSISASTSSAVASSATASIESQTRVVNPDGSTTITTIYSDGTEKVTTTAPDPTKATKVSTKESDQTKATDTSQTAATLNEVQGPPTKEEAAARGQTLSLLV